MKYKDITGKKYGRLTPLAFHHRDADAKKTYWSFRCDCGQEVALLSDTVTRGDTKSCGCLRVEKSRQRGRNSAKHGLSTDRFYNIYYSLFRRCNDRFDKDYHRYGGRDIKCSWSSFEEFRNDMYQSYQKHVKQYGEANTQIDREDNNGPYSKLNCRWATISQQARNRRSNRMIEMDGESKCLIEWTELYNANYARVHGRLSMGWSLRDALTI